VAHKFGIEGRIPILIVNDKTYRTVFICLILFVSH